MEVRPRKRRKVQAAANVEIDVDDQSFDALIKEASEEASALENAYVPLIVFYVLVVFPVLPLCMLSSF